MLPLPPNYESLQTSPQSQCPIFVSLPPEIRRLIWIKCLGGLRVPLSFSNQYRCDRLCSHGGLAGSSPLCNQTNRPKVKKRIEHRLLPILLTCQRVYSEAIGILYSCNVFDLPDTRYLLDLPKLLIPPHFNAIRSLNFTLRLQKKCPILIEALSKHDRDQLRISWASQWTNIALMEGLRELYVQMTAPNNVRDAWIREQISLLEPLKAITRPKVFVLTLPYLDPAENESFLQELPCQIRRARKTIYG